MANRFQSINSSSNISAIVNQVNKNFGTLDREAVTKKFGQGDNTVIIGKIDDNRVGLVVGEITGNAIVYGKYRADRFGTLYYQAGIPVRLEGQAPDDGRMGSWQVRPGENVLTQLGG